MPSITLKPGMVVAYHSNITSKTRAFMPLTVMACDSNGYLAVHCEDSDESIFIQTHYDLAILDTEEKLNQCRRVSRLTRMSEALKAESKHAQNGVLNSVRFEERSAPSTETNTWRWNNGHEMVELLIKVRDEFLLRQGGTEEVSV